MDSHQVEAIAEAIVKRMAIPLDAQYWSLREIGASYKVSTEHARRITATNGFPAPIRLPSGDTSGHPRWKAVEVIEWFDSYKIDAPVRKD